MHDIDFKNPYIIGGGVLLVLFLVMRGSSSAATPTSSASALASQNIAANAAIAPAQIAAGTQQNADNLNASVQTNLANNQMLASIVGSALAAQGNIVGGVTQTFTANANTGNTLAANAVSLPVATLNANTAINLAGINSTLQQYITGSNNNTALNINGQNTTAATTINNQNTTAATSIAQINASAQQQIASINANAGNINSGITGVTGLVGKIL